MQRPESRLTPKNHWQEVIDTLRWLEEGLNESDELRVSKETERKMRILANRIIEKILETEVAVLDEGRKDIPKG